MVLAAGLGTRLRPLTNDRPKALVTVAGRTLLEITLARLREFGVRDVVINVHHFADLVIDFLNSNANFGMNIEISREDVLLDTGGGLKKVAEFFLRTPDQPFLLHNVDVISDIDFESMLHHHRHHNAGATLATQHRKTSRQLLFDNEGLCGRHVAGNDPQFVRATADPDPVGFGGIHIISPRLLNAIQETGVFSIVDSYLRLAAQGERIVSFSADPYYWRDLGTPASIAAAERDYSNKLWA